jgi:hypothetical protein
MEWLTGILTGRVCRRLRLEGTTTLPYSNSPSNGQDRPSTTADGLRGGPLMTAHARKNVAHTRPCIHIEARAQQTVRREHKKRAGPDSHTQFLAYTTVSR